MLGEKVVLDLSNPGPSFFHRGPAKALKQRAREVCLFEKLVEILFFAIPALFLSPAIRMYFSNPSNRHRHINSMC